MDSKRRTICRMDLVENLSPKQNMSAVIKNPVCHSSSNEDMDYPVGVYSFKSFG